MNSWIVALIGITIGAAIGLFLSTLQPTENNTPATTFSESAQTPASLAPESDATIEESPNTQAPASRYLP